MSTPSLSRWVEQAACRGGDASLFFPQRGHRAVVVRAKAICATCPVTQPCRAWALAHPAERGIWGGLTEAERHAVRRRQRREHAA